MIKRIEYKIRRVRELKNITQEYLALELGLSTRAYSKIENGETQLTFNRLNEISRILGMSAREIIDFDEKILLSTEETAAEGKKENGFISEKLLEQYEKTIHNLEREVELLYRLLKDR